MKEEKRLCKIRDRKYVRRLFLLCWMVYCVSYIGRLNYSSAMAQIISEHILTASQAGFISMAYFFAYGIGQMINGFLGDRINPRRMIFAGLLCSGLANVAMGISHSAVWMALSWGANGYFQAMIWAPIIRIFAEMLHGEDRVNCSVNIVSSQIIGTLLSYLLSAGVLAIADWPWVFIAAAILLAATSLLWSAGFWDVCRHREAVGEESGIKEEHKQEEGEVQISFGKLMISSGIMTLLIPIMVHGMLKDGVTAWVPTYISESFGIAASFSVLLTSILPVVNLSGAYLARSVYRRTRERIGLSVLAFFATATAGLLLLCTVGGLSPVLATCFLAVITASMMAVNTLVVNIYPLRFRRYGRVSGVSGFLNAMAYLGTAISTFTTGLIVQYWGWQTTIYVWLAVTVLAGLICLLFVRTEGKK
ncbi:MAG TPA: MFS transporter [Lachnospiraceae bacterium]|nr:MFS transporter [Lachnospiraceae bacterium]HCM13623.1 MFS transporter [Lachnospiraceae bacterium]HCR41223.1 MFS transporter [Lachnospiraceae bacterium]